MTRRYKVWSVVTALFTALTTEYLTDTRTGDGPVSTLRTAAELAARFDEPMPRDGSPCPTCEATK